MSSLAKAKPLIMASAYRVGVVQMTSTDDRLLNYETCARLAAKASAQNCQFLSFPECFHFIGGGKTGLRSLDIAEDLEGSTIQKYQRLARETNMTLSLGGFQEKSRDPKKVYNTHVIINSNGDLISTYKKIHLFDFPDGGLMESSFTIAGDEAKVVKCDQGINFGLSTCYDLRFPELYQVLRSLEANVMLIPSAFTEKTGVAHWHILCRARAIETQSYVLAAAQGGAHNEKRTSFGHALIIDPWGNIVAEGEKNEMMSSGSQLLVADLDLELIQQIRQKMPIEIHKRHDVYEQRAKE